MLVNFVWMVAMVELRHSLGISRASEVGFTVVQLVTAALGVVATWFLCGLVRE